MPAINPTIELLRRELLRFGPYGAFRDRIELTDYFLQAPARDADWDGLTDPLTVGESEIIMVANPNWALTGDGPADPADQVLDADGGFALTTDGTDNDQAICFPRGAINSIVSTAWASLTLEPQHEARFQAIIELPAITALTIQFGLGLLANLELGGASQIDADYAKIQFSTEGAVSTTKFTAMDGIAGTDVETVLETTDVVAVDTTYNLEVRYSSTGVARFYIDGVKKHTTSVHTAAAALHPVFGIQALGGAVKVVKVRQLRVSRVWQDS